MLKYLQLDNQDTLLQNVMLKYPQVLFYTTAVNIKRLASHAASQT